MLKRLVLILVLLIGLLPCFPFAGMFENLTTATFYDFNSEDLYFGGYIPILGFKDIVEVDAGLVTASEQGIPFAGLSIDLRSACALVRLNYYLPEPIKIGGFGARNFTDDKWLYGLFLGVVW